MAVTSATLHRCLRLSRFVLLTLDAARLAVFYEQALGFAPRAAERLVGPSVAQLGIDGGAIGLTLRLGLETIELIQCDKPGQPIISDAVSSDVAFQHLAIVVNDMREAYRRLCDTKGWHAISTGGPQRLPDSSGGVTAFKFRDPDGHPLELLAFPNEKMPAHWRDATETGCCKGIDHSAISICDITNSIAFYGALGLDVVSRSLNHGLEQAQLDNIVAPQVDVIALAFEQATPHLELLGYRDIRRRKSPMPHANDITATRLIFETNDDRATGHCLSDPDGHRIVLEPWHSSILSQST